MLMHLGYPKAASTFLQRSFFRYTENGYWPVFVEKADQHILNRLLVTRDAFDDVTDDLKNAIAERVAMRSDSSLVPVISAEDLVGTAVDPTRALAKLVADRLKAAVPHGKVLIVIRNQVSMLRSNYLYYIRGGGRFGLKRFLLRPHMFEFHHWSEFHLSFLKYDNIARYYMDLFGDSQIKVMPFEMILNNAQKFIGEINDFCGVRAAPRHLDYGVVKARIPTGSAVPRRFMNNFFSNDEMNPFSAILPESLYWRVYTKSMRKFDALAKMANLDRPDRLDDRIIQIVGDFYRESNRQTMELTGIDLGAYGYDI
jgi:hypothetical protein